MTAHHAKRIYSWDSSVFLAWLKGEECHPLADMEQVAAEVTDGSAFMLVSTQAYEEIQFSRCTPEQLKKIQAFLSRTNVELAQQTPAITRKAAEIVSESLAAGLVTKIKDARIVATAIVLDASVLHSVDDGLLRLSGKDIVDGLIISKPVSLTGQKGLL